MIPTLLSAYVLVWPLLVAAVLFVLVRGFAREWRRAMKEGRSMI